MVLQDDFGTTGAADLFIRDQQGAQTREQNLISQTSSRVGNLRGQQSASQDPELQQHQQKEVGWGTVGFLIVIILLFAGVQCFILYYSNEYDKKKRYEQWLRQRGSLLRNHSGNNGSSSGSNSLNNPNRRRVLNATPLTPILEGTELAKGEQQDENSELPSTLSPPGASTTSSAGGAPSVELASPTTATSGGGFSSGTTAAGARTASSLVQKKIPL